MLTAAHCVNTKTARDIKVRVGLHTLDDPDIEGKTYFVEQIIQHDYTTPTKPGDIAILKLTKPIQFISGQVEPACYNTLERQYESELKASGWGTTTISKKIQGKLETGKLIKLKKKNYKILNLFSFYYFIGVVSPVLKQAYFTANPKCENYLICIDSAKRDSVCQVCLN